MLDVGKRTPGGTYSGPPPAMSLPMRHRACRTQSLCPHVIHQTTVQLPKTLESLPRGKPGSRACKSLSPWSILTKAELPRCTPKAQVVGGQGMVILTDTMARGGVGLGIPCNVGKNQMGRKEEQALPRGCPALTHCGTDLSLRILNSNLTFQSAETIMIG